MWPPVWNDYVSASFWHFVVLLVIFHFTWCHTNACFISIVRKRFYSGELVIVNRYFVSSTSSYKIFVFERCYHWELCVCVFLLHSTKYLKCFHIKKCVKINLSPNIQELIYVYWGTCYSLILNINNNTYYQRNYIIVCNNFHGDTVMCHRCAKKSHTFPFLLLSSCHRNSFYFWAVLVSWIFFLSFLFTSFCQFFSAIFLFGLAFNINIFCILIFKNNLDFFLIIFAKRIISTNSRVWWAFAHTSYVLCTTFS